MNVFANALHWNKTDGDMQFMCTAGHSNNFFSFSLTQREVSLNKASS